MWTRLRGFKPLPRVTGTNDSFAYKVCHARGITNGSSEDIPPDAHTYHWTPDHPLKLKKFLSKYRPSKVQDDSTKWIWVQGTKRVPASPVNQQLAAAAEASEILSAVTQKVEEIKNDDSIPAQSHNKAGAKGKKELLEQERAAATQRLKEVSIKHGFTSGKWLIFATSNQVDHMWSNLARSLVAGPLSNTAALRAEVTPRPKISMPKKQHVLCLCMPNVYDQAAVTKVMKILLEQHDGNPVGVKSDLYAKLKINSTHASGLQPTIWKSSALMKESDIKALKDVFLSKLAASEPTNAMSKPSALKSASSSGEALIQDPSKSAPQPKEADEDVPFEGSSDADMTENVKPKLTGKMPIPKKTKGKRKGKRKGIPAKAEKDGGEPKAKESA